MSHCIFEPHLSLTCPVGSPKPWDCVACNLYGMTRPIFGLIEHGMDNYNELLNLGEIAFVRGSWRPKEKPKKGEEKLGNWTVKIVLKSGHEETVEMSESGWDWLMGALNVR